MLLKYLGMFMEVVCAVQVYSFGVCLWEIVERERPFEGMTYYEIATQWLSNPEEMKLPPLSIPKDATATDTLILNACQDLVMQCTSMGADRYALS